MGHLFVSEFLSYDFRDLRFTSRHIIILYIHNNNISVYDRVVYYCACNAPVGCLSLKMTSVAKIVKYITGALEVHCSLTPGAAKYLHILLLFIDTFARRVYKRNHETSLFSRIHYGSTTRFRHSNKRRTYPYPRG